MPEQVVFDAHVVNAFRGLMIFGWTVLFIWWCGQLAVDLAESKKHDPPG